MLNEILIHYKAAIATPYHFPGILVQSYVLFLGTRATKNLATHATVVFALKESELRFAVPAVRRLIIGYPLRLFTFFTENILTCFYIFHNYLSINYT